MFGRIFCGGLAALGVFALFGHRHYWEVRATVVSGRGSRVWVWVSVSVSVWVWVWV